MSNSQNSTQPKKEAKQAPKEVKAPKKDASPSKIEQLSDYFRQSRAELRKVSWPTIKETRTTTFVVFAFVAVMAILLGLVDLSLSSIVGLILS